MDISTIINDSLSATDAALLYLILSTFVQALPKPGDSAHPAYVFLYKFAHGIVYNWRVVLDKKKHEAVESRA